MGEHVVARVDEVPDDRGLIVEAGGRELGLFRVGDSFYALRNLCPHQSGPLGEGGIFPALRARVVRERIEEYYDRENVVVACPWHGWEFDLRSGVCLADPGRRVACYETVVREGRVAVVLPEGDRP